MINIEGICYIVGASEEKTELSFIPKKNDLVIAADGGYDLLKKSGIEADILLGDFDSLQSQPEHNCIITYPAEKDDTDSFLAYKLGYEKGYRIFVIYGGIGGRIDHTIANIQMLNNMAKKGARGFLVGNNTIISSLYNSSINFSSRNIGKIGVFASGKDAVGINISGLKYEMENGTLTSDFPLGVSNEFIGKNAKVSINDGALVLVWYESDKDFLSKLKNYLEAHYDY